MGGARLAKACAPAGLDPRCSGFTAAGRRRPDTRGPASGCCPWPASSADAGRAVPPLAREPRNLSAGKSIRAWAMEPLKPGLDNGGHGDTQTWSARHQAGDHAKR